MARMRIAAMTLALVLSKYASAPMDHTRVTDADLPVVCTLTPEQMESARAALIPGLLARADSVTDLANGLHVRFTTRAGLRADLAQMMEQERGCCRFLRFELTAEPAHGAVTLSITGPSGTREVLRSRWRTDQLVRGAEATMHMPMMTTPSASLSSSAAL
jgi:hypothetical protein